MSIVLNTESISLNDNYYTLYWDGNTLKFENTDLLNQSGISITIDNNTSSITLSNNTDFEKYYGNIGQTTSEITFTYENNNTFKQLNIFNNVQNKIINFIYDDKKRIPKFITKLSFGDILFFGTGKQNDNITTYYYIKNNSDIDYNYSISNKIDSILSITNIGNVFMWGNNTYGQLGDNSTTSKKTPIKICGNITFCQVSSGLFNNSLGLDYQGMAWSWGRNQNGQLGDNSTTNRSTPIRVCGNITFCQIFTRYTISTGIDYQGMAWSWGYNAYGSLGDNTTNTCKSTPIRICGNITFCQINVNNYTALALDYQGMAWSWGYNGLGGLGDNSAVDKSTPVRVCGNITFCKISAGQYYSLGLDYQGMAWSWGYNPYGGLGDNSTTSRRTPIRVCGNITFCQIMASEYFSIGLDYQGMAWSWGYNSYGVLGDNTTTNRSTPIRVCGNITFCQISVSNYTGIGLDYRGVVWTWGYNATGELGDNTTTSKCTPVQVLF